MHIGRKNGNIVIFSETLEELQANALIRGIALDSIGETSEEIVPSYNLCNDGIYYKASEVPQIPVDIANEIIRGRRRELYALMSDPLTNNISVLQDSIELEDYESENERQAIEDEIIALHGERKSIRNQIMADNPFVGE
jgi:hypothetical protein